MNEQPSVSQTVVNGTLGTPAVFTGILLLNAVMMGIGIAMLYNAADRQKELATEVRVLGLHVQDTNAVLLKRGIIQPNDLISPTGAQ